MVSSIFCLKMRVKEMEMEMEATEVGHENQNSITRNLPV